MGLKKVQKQGRDERTQEDYPTSAKNTQQMSGNLPFNVDWTALPPARYSQRLNSTMDLTVQSTCR